MSAETRQMRRAYRQSRRAWSPAPAVRASMWLHGAVAAAFVAWPSAWRWFIASLVADHLLLGCFGMWPRSSLLGPNLSRLPGGSGSAFVVLTFDDGPDPEVTPQVLKLLDRYHAKASFFCIGQRAAAFPHIVQEIVRRGHSVENHSDRHPTGFACLPPGALRREVSRAQQTLTGIAGTAPRFFRAPFGIRSPLLDPALCSIPVRYVSWTRRGFDCTSRSPDNVLRRITRGLGPGDILLLHDTAASRTPAGVPIVLEVLPQLLEQIDAAGLQVLSLPLAVPQPSVAWARA